MTLNNHATNAPVPVPMPCDFVVKNASNMLPNCFRDRESWSRIFDRDHDCIAIVERCSHPQHPISIRRGIHCLNCVLDQIREDLLQLSPVARNKRQF